MSHNRFVVDTTALISYFAEVFGKESQISRQGLLIMERSFANTGAGLLVFPSVVFIEIYDKWFRGSRSVDEEFRAKFNTEIFQVIRAAENMEIREIDIEVLEVFLNLDDPEINLENRDKIIVASAIVLNAPIITSDRKIKDYVNKHNISSPIIT